MAKTIVIFDSAKRELMTGGLNLSDTYRLYLLTAGWTPSIDTSTRASLTAYMCPTISGDRTAGRQFSAIGDFTKTADGVLKFDLPDITCTASTGTNLSAMYGVIIASAATMPLLYWEISTAEVVASQINITMPTEGVFETSDNS